MQVVGHGIPKSTIAAMRAASDEFFALPLDRKLLVRPAHPGINRGYAARGTEALSYSLGIVFTLVSVRPPCGQVDVFNGGGPVAASNTSALIVTHDESVSPPDADTGKFGK